MPPCGGTRAVGPGRCSDAWASYRLTTWCSAAQAPARLPPQGPVLWCTTTSSCCSSGSSSGWQLPSGVLRHLAGPGGGGEGGALGHRARRGGGGGGGDRRECAAGGQAISHAAAPQHHPTAWRVPEAASPLPGARVRLSQQSVEPLPGIPTHVLVNWAVQISGHALPTGGGRGAILHRDLKSSNIW